MSGLAAQDSYPSAAITPESAQASGLASHLGPAEFEIVGSHECPACCYTDTVKMSFFAKVVTIAKDITCCGPCKYTNSLHTSIPRNRVRSVQIQNEVRNPITFVIAGSIMALLTFILFIMAAANIGQECYDFGWGYECYGGAGPMTWGYFAVCFVITIFLFVWPKRFMCCCRPQEHIVVVGTDDSQNEIYCGSCCPIYTLEYGRTFSIQTGSVSKTTLESVAKYASTTTDLSDHGLFKHSQV